MLRQISKLSKRIKSSFSVLHINFSLLKIFLVVVYTESYINAYINIHIKVTVTNKRTHKHTHAHTHAHTHTHTHPKSSFLMKTSDLIKILGKLREIT